MEPPPIETNPAAERQQLSINMLAEWSRWLIAVGVVAAAGCVAVLKMGAEGTQRDELICAVGCFLVSMALAAILGFIVAWVKSEPPTEKRHHCVWLFAIFQFATLTLGGYSLYSWVRNVGIATTPPLAEPSEDVRANVRAILGDELIRIGQELQKPEAKPVRRPFNIKLPERGGQ